VPKGSANERSKCKDWSLWWTEGQRDDIFWRTSGSGSRAKVRAKAGKTTAGSYGDIMAIDPIGEPLIEVCTIELKKGYSDELDLLSLFDSRAKKHTIKGFLAQVRYDSNNANNFPILEVHRDYRKPVLFIDSLLCNEMENYYGVFDYPVYMRLRFNTLGGFTVIRREVFFEWCGREFFTWFRERRI